MRLRLPRRWILRAPIYLLCLLLVLIAVDMIWVQMWRSFQPGFDTTRIVGPLLDNGSIDYLTAIEKYYEDGVTPQNNSAVLILQALGRKALPSKQPTDGITERMGMPHLPEQGDYYVSYDDYCKQHGAVVEDDPVAAGEKIAFPLTVGPQTKQWLESLAKPLSLMTEASKRSRYFMPFNGGYRYETLPEIQLPHVLPLMQMHRPFLTRAMLHLQEGDFDGFHEDVMTVHRLARLIGQASTMVERRNVAGEALEAASCTVDRAAAASGKLSAAQARQLAGELAAMGDLKSFDDALNVGERYMWLDTLQVLAKSSPTRMGELINAIDFSGQGARIDPPQAFWLIPIPFEASMRTANHFDDGVLAILGLPTYPQRAEAFGLWEDQVQGVERHSSVWSYMTPDWSVATFLPAMVNAEQRSDAVRMQRRLSQIALGLAAYKADHGGYPASLDALTPGYLAAVPNDIFSEKPVIYAPTQNGYTLYSVGPNMIDDGGKSRRPADDIVASVP